MATSKLKDNAVINGKLEDLSVSETKIQDDSIATPKLKAEAVTAAKILADTITASEIAAGTITALEIAADTITASEIFAGTITASEIAADTLTATEIDSLSLATNQLSIGTNADETLDFDTETFQSLGEIVRVEPSSDEGAIIGSLSAGKRIFELYATTIRATNEIKLGDGAQNVALGGGEMAIHPDNNTQDNEILFTTADGSASVDDIAIIPSEDDDGLLGSGDGSTATKAWQEIHAHNVFTYTPEPLQKNEIDMRELQNSTWQDPPLYASQGQDKEGNSQELPQRKDGTRGIEMAHMLNYVFEVCKKQQDKIDSLEQRISEIEQNLSGKGGNSRQ